MQSSPRVDGLANGDYAVVWVTGNRIYTRVFNASGSAQSNVLEATKDTTANKVNTVYVCMYV